MKKDFIGERSSDRIMSKNELFNNFKKNCLSHKATVRRKRGN